MQRRIGILTLVITLWIGWAAPAAAETLTPNAQAAVLLDGLSGQILYDHNGSAPNYPASTTKLLTALVAVEHGDLNQIITISDRAVDQPPDSSSCYLERGEQHSLEHLLYGLLIASGNDCAAAIAEGVTGGHPETFIDWMNETARRLGATRSHFTNPHGLHDPEHYTTASDLAIIARAALANPTVRNIAGTKEFFWPGKSEQLGIYYNHNRMLWTYDGTIGGKTGFTEQAGLTLVSAAKRGDRLLIGVIMGERFKAEQYREMAALLDYGFERFEQVPVVEPGERMGNIPVRGGKSEQVEVVAGGSFRISVPRGEEPGTTIHPVLSRDLVKAPIQKGEPLGHVEIRENGRLLGTVPLVAAHPVESASLLPEGLLQAASGDAKWLAYLLAGFFVWRILLRGLRRGRRRARRRPTYRRRLGGSRVGMISAYRTKWR